MTSIEFEKPWPSSATVPATEASSSSAGSSFRCKRLGRLIVIDYNSLIIDKLDENIGLRQCSKIRHVK